MTNKTFHVHEFDNDIGNEAHDDDANLQVVKNGLQAINLC